MSVEVLKPPIDLSPHLRKASSENKWDYNQITANIYRRADVMMDRFYHGIAIPGFPAKLPTPVFAVEAMNKRTLGAYNLVPDAYGLPFRITLNEVHFVEQEKENPALGLLAQAMVWRWGDWSLNEVTAHELGHHWHQLKGRDPYKAGKVTHNKEFCAKMESIGLHPTLGTGAHYAVADADSPFGLLMREWGIERPADVPREEVKRYWWDVSYGEGPAGRSSLSKWNCAICLLAIRVGVKGDIQLTHDDDGGKFVRG